MLKEPLPFLISIPHGGTKTPAELKNHVIITPHDLFDDSDVFTNEIYDVDGLVFKVLKTDIARAFVDLNRAPNELPPTHPDGIIKSCTCLRKPIYAADKHPNTALRQQLIKKYYQPYHTELNVWSRFPRIKLGLDCHSMLPVAPAISPDQDQKRPLINLGNLDGTACPDKIVQLMIDAFCLVFEITAEHVTMNRPFKGGYITKKYANKPIPWIQIEMNRILYLDEFWFDRASLSIDQNRISTLNSLFAQVLTDFYSSIQKKYPEFLYG
jgi:formiminoglutamase